jgi:ribulose-bisphosphate carboxylase large chain
MLPNPSVALGGGVFRATYEVAAAPGEVEAVAEAIAVEQTLEFPAHLLPAGDIRDRVKGQVEAIRPLDDGRYAVRIAYADEVTGYELLQWLNVLFGNVSLLPGVRLTEVEPSATLLSRFRGPRYGRAGLRHLMGVERRPLLATALKPMGLPVTELAQLAATFAASGLDLIKDDHGLANQPFAPWRERVAACAEAVCEQNAKTGATSIYLPSVNGRQEDLLERAHWAKAVGAGGLLVMPALVGWDTMRALADDDTLGLPLLSHPAFLGGLARPTEGVAPAVLFGLLMRWAGADAVIFPNYGGRFSFRRDECLAIAGGTSVPMAHIKPIFPVPSGGMSLERVPEIVETYGGDVVLLIGGGLFSNGMPLSDACRRFRDLVEAPPI